MPKAGLCLFVMVVSSAAAGPEPPDMRGVLNLSTPRGGGHGCPIAAEFALTAGHVLDAGPFTTQLLGARWSDDYGNEGKARPYWVSGTEDLGVLKGKFRHVFRLASRAPLPGELVYYKEYDWRSDKTGYGTSYKFGTVTRVVAGTVIFRKEAPNPGASGSCLLNSNNEVVGIVSFYHKMDNGSAAGGAVGVWGEFAEAIKEVIKVG